MHTSSVVSPRPRRLLQAASLSQPSKEGPFHTAFGKTGAHEWTTIALFQSDSSYGETENVKHDHDEQEKF